MDKRNRKIVKCIDDSMNFTRVINVSKFFRLAVHCPQSINAL